MHLSKLLILLALFCTAGTARALCGGPLDDNDFQQPLDYRATDEWQVSMRQMVERNHFNRDVETLRAPMHGPLPGDIHFLLIHFPNHYRALQSMARWHRENAMPPNANFFSAECYFERALAFTPNDENIYLIYGTHLYELDKIDGAISAFQRAAELNPKSPEAHYNLGLMYVEQAEYAKADEHARIAYGLGHPMPGLRNKLKAAGVW